MFFGLLRAPKRSPNVASPVSTATLSIKSAKLEQAMNRSVRERSAGSMWRFLKVSSGWRRRHEWL